MYREEGILEIKEKCFLLSKKRCYGCQGFSKLIALLMEALGLPGQIVPYNC